MSASARVGPLGFVWQSECFSHIAMEQRIEVSDFPTRWISGLRGDALSHFWRSSHLYLHQPVRPLSFVLTLVLACPLLAQSSVPASDDGGALFEIRPRQYLFGDWAH
jgi:hypothetical protein